VSWADVLSGAARWSVDRGDCLDLARTLPDACVDAVVTDPPAAIGFMGRRWDSDRGGRAQWVAWFAERMAEALRILKPGGHALVWALPRTSHWTAWAIEDAGFEIRNVIHHLFATGFPKSLDFAAEKTTPVRIVRPEFVGTPFESGWGTDVKPAAEHWILARKPLVGTVARNVREHGVGALNIDACRVATGDDLNGGAYSGDMRQRQKRAPSDSVGAAPLSRLNRGIGEYVQPSGRFPANVALSHADGCERVGRKRVKAHAAFGSPADSAGGILNRTGAPRANPHPGYASADGTEEVDDWRCVDGCPVRALDAQSGTLKSDGTAGKQYERKAYSVDSGWGSIQNGPGKIHADSGGASRFYYTAKPSTAERDAGCEGFYWRRTRGGYARVSREEWADLPSAETAVGNIHATVKSIDLMRWLCRLVTPPGGIVADFFCGSGSTGSAAVLEHLRFVGCDLDLGDDGGPAGYVGLARARIAHWDHTDEARQQPLFARAGGTP